MAFQIGRRQGQPCIGFAAERTADEGLDRPRKGSARGSPRLARLLLILVIGWRGGLAAGHRCSSAEGLHLCLVGATVRKIGAAESAADVRHPAVGGLLRKRRIVGAGLFLFLEGELVGVHAVAEGQNLSFASTGSASPVVPAGSASRRSQTAACSAVANSHWRGCWEATCRSHRLRLEAPCPKGTWQPMKMKSEIGRAHV